MHRFQTRTARRWLALAACGAALALLGVWIAQRADDDQQRTALDTTTLSPVSTKDEPAPAESESVSKTEGEADKASPPPPLPYDGRLVPEGYQWRDPHPWLVPIPGSPHFRYIGPQTAEAIFAVMSSGHEYYQQEDEAKKLLEHYRYILSRGAVIHDDWDAVSLGQNKADNIDRWRENPDVAAYKRRVRGLPADATLQELQDAEIDHWIKIWPPMKEQFNHADKTGESTLNVTLLPDGRGSGAIAISTAGNPNPRKLTPEEKYNISRHGIAPEGFRLRFVDEDDNELLFHQAPFFSERDLVKHWSDAELEEALIALPGFMSQPEAFEQPNVVWMSMVDRYDAALAELEARRQAAAAPSAASGASAERPPVETPRAPPGLRGSESEPPPVLQRETESPAARAKREAAQAERFKRAAEAESFKRAAEEYVKALEKLAKRKDISSEARERLSRRIQELRVLSAAVTAPPAPLSDEDESKE